MFILSENANTLSDVMDEIDTYLTTVTETPAEGYQLQQLGKYDKNGPKDKAVRKIDALNMQLKHGKISKEDFDKKANEIIQKDGTVKSYGQSYQWLNKNGSKNVTNKLVARPNKEKSNMTKNDFFTHGNNSVIDAKNIDPNTMEKLKRHMTFMQTTDDENEYKQHRKALLKTMGQTDKKVIDNAAIAPYNIYKDTFNGQLSGANGAIPVDKEGQNNTFIHTSPKEGLTKLEPTMRSKDGVFYPGKSVYFSKGKPMSHMGGLPAGSNGLNKYAYTGDARKNAIVDPELGGDAVVIRSKYGLPVTQMK